MSGREDVKREDFFRLQRKGVTQTWFEGKKLRKDRRGGMCQDTFSQRVVNPWNKLSKGKVISWNQHQGSKGNLIVWRQTLHSGPVEDLMNSLISGFSKFF